LPEQVNVGALPVCLHANGFLGVAPSGGVYFFLSGLLPALANRSGNRINPWSWLAPNEVGALAFFFRLPHGSENILEGPPTFANTRLTTRGSPTFSN